MTFITQNTTSSKQAAMSAFARYSAYVGRLIQEFVNRQEMKRSMGRLSERDLRDIGLMKDDTDSTLRAPMSSDASQMLHNALRGRASNW